MKEQIKGVYAVACTAFDADGAFDERAYRRHICYLLDTGKVHGIIPAGSTGEFAFLTEAERERVVKTAIDEVGKRVPVFAGAAACSTGDTVAYAQAAQKMGADGVMVVSPYYGHLDQEELYGHFSTLAQNLDIPIMVYNNPGTSGSDILPTTLARLAKFDRIVAIKESTGIMQRVAEIQRLCGDGLQVLCGCDTLVLEMFRMGVTGWVAAPANVVAKDCVELWETAVVKQDYEKARQLYFRVLPVFDLFEGSGKYVQLAKAGLEMMGKSIGQPRLPLLPIDSELSLKLESLLKGLELL